MLRLLRVLPMARHAFIALLFAGFLSVPVLAQSTAQPLNHASAHPRTARTRTAHPRAIRRTARYAAHRATVHPASARAAHRRRTTRHTVRSRRVVHRRTVHPRYAHSRREARLRHYRRARSAVHHPREATSAAHGNSSAASALALTITSPILPRAARRETIQHAPAASRMPAEPRTAPATAADIPPALPIPPGTAVEAASFRPDRIVPTAPLRGTLASLERQNQRTQADGLERILNNTDLDDRIARGFLVPIPVSAGLTVNDRLPLNHRYCRPWTADFLADLARAHDAEFHRSLEVSSAVRTIDYQKRLERINGNAASAVGEIVSPHVTGATIDITKKGMSTREIYWMRIVLRGLQQEGAIDVEEEFHQACFHITVYKSYLSRNALRQARRRELTTEAVDDSSY